MDMSFGVTTSKIRLTQLRGYKESQLNVQFNEVIITTLYPTQYNMLLPPNHSTVLANSNPNPKTFVNTPKIRKTLKSGCLSLLTIRSFGARDGLGLTVRVWLGFGLGGRLGLSILYQMPVSLLKLTMWLRGYSRWKKVGLNYNRALNITRNTPISRNLRISCVSNGRDYYILCVDCSNRHSVKSSKYFALKF
eukprot:sb/3471053/